MGTFPRNIRLEDRRLASRDQRMTTRVDTEAQPKSPKYASKLPGDPIALRGIPAIGRGVGGAVFGTSPDRVIMSSEGRA